MVKKSDKAKDARKPAPLNTKTTVKNQTPGKTVITDAAQTKTSGERNAYLASFPELNTNPILELDKKGNLLYQNPACRRLFPDLSTLGLQHPFLTRWNNVVKKLLNGNILKPLVREITFGNQSFEQVILAVGKNQIRIYARDITKRTNAEEALKASEQNFHNSMDSSPVGIRISDDEDGTLYANQVFLKLFDYANLEELKATPPLKRYTPAAFADFLLRGQKQERGEPRPDSVVIEIVRKNGEIRHLRLFTRELLWYGKRQYQNLYIDITEQHHAEAALKTFEQNFRNSIDNSPVGVRIVDDQWHTFYANQVFLDIHGYSTTAELDSVKPEKLFPPAEYARYLKRRESHAQGKPEPDKLELDIIRKDGEIRHIKVTRTEVIWNCKTGYQVTYYDITESKKIEEALRISEEKYATIIEQSTDVILILKDRKVEFANQRICEMTGYSQQEVLGKYFYELAAPEYRKLLDDIYLRWTADEQASVSHEMEIITKAGKKVPVETKIRPIIYQGSPAGMLIVQDITERKQNEEALKLSEQNFRNSMDSFLVGIRISDNRDENLYANQAMLEIFGYKNIEEIQAHPPQDFYAPPDHAAWVQRHEKFVRGQPMPKQIGINIIRPDGKVRNLQVSMKAVFWNGKLRYQTLYSDVTDLKQAEEEKYESEAKYRIIVENSHDMIFSINSENKYVYVSPSVKNMLGYEPDEIIGILFVSLVHPDDRHIIEEETQRSLAPGYKVSEDIEYRIRHASGEWRWVVSRGTRVVDINGNFLYFSGIARDNTEHKQAEEEKKRIEEKAQISSRLAAVGEMAAGIAHEINNPLTGVLGFSQMTLEKDNIPDDIRENLTLIADGSRRVADIVKRLLTFARQSKPVKTFANINELVENTLKMREYVLKTNNINIVMSLDSELPWSVVDAGQMQQVFLNLIVNAEQAMKKAHGKGTLIITTKKQDDFIRISFKDDGPGITQENLKRLFEPFFTTKDPGEGTGLGLSLSRAIVLEHDGKMNVESESGRGATFIVEIPIMEALPSDVEILDQNLEMTSPASKTGRILVIDDETGVRALVEKILTSIGHQVEMVADAGTAKNKIDAGELYDVIITDIRMPGVNGIELYYWIVERIPKMKNRIIFITGDVMGQDIKTFLAENNLPFLSKPFAVESLKDQVNRILETGDQIK